MATKSTIGIKYLKHVKLLNGGIISLVAEKKRPKKGKGSGCQTSNVKRIFQLTNIVVITDRLIQLLSGHEKKLNSKWTLGKEILKIFSNSGLTNLEVKPIVNGIFLLDGLSVISGQATYQTLQQLGLNNLVIVIEEKQPKNST